jgi:dienelactone hydrolase
MAADFGYERPAHRPNHQEIISQRSDYTVRRVTFPSVANASPSRRRLNLLYYAPAKVEKAPAILVLPMLGGSYDLEKHFAGYFAKRGIAALIVLRDRKRLDPNRLENLNLMLKQTVLDNKQVIDWIEDQPELDAGRVGVFGISMGGIKGALVAALDARVEAAVLALAGCDLPYILTHSTEPGIIKQRQEYMRRENIALEELEQRLRKAITCDPLAYAPYVDPPKVLLILALNDTVVPAVKGQELRQKMGNPETIAISAGHYSAILYLPYIQNRALNFFRRRFAADGEGAPAVPTEPSRRPGIFAGKRNTGTPHRLGIHGK